MGRLVAVSHVVGRFVVVAVSIVALVLALGILLRVLRANPDNGVVSLVYSVGHFLAGPFNEVFKPRDPRTEIAVNWGIALAVYLLVGGGLSRLLARVSPDP